MAVYMDRHYIEGATQHAVADAHQKDLALQDKYNIKFLTYWFDEARCTAFCLIEAPNRKTIEQAHTRRTAPSPMKFSRSTRPWWMPFWVGSKILHAWIPQSQNQLVLPWIQVSA
jgi:Protein of unknown function (DUF4242)